MLAPQCGQKLEPADTSLPHLGHSISFLLLDKRFRHEDLTVSHTRSFRQRDQNGALLKKHEFKKPNFSLEVLTMRLEAKFTRSKERQAKSHKASFSVFSVILSAYKFYNNCFPVSSFGSGQW